MIQINFGNSLFENAIFMWLFEKIIWKQNNIRIIPSEIKCKIQVHDVNDRMKVHFLV